MQKSTEEVRAAEQLAHVRNVLLAVDPNGDLIQAGETLAAVIQSDSAAAGAFKEILQHISIKSLDDNARRIYDRYLVLYNRALRVQGNADPEPFGGPDGFADLLTVGYLYAQDVLRSPGAREKLSPEALRSRLPDAARQIGTMLDREFLARLLLETKTRAHRDPAFARAIESGKATLIQTLPQLTEPSTIAQQAGGGSSGGACFALGFPPGSRACWVAGLICVVIVVVAKASK